MACRPKTSRPASGEGRGRLAGFFEGWSDTHGRDRAQGHLSQFHLDRTQELLRTQFTLFRTYTLTSSLQPNGCMLAWAALWYDPNCVWRRVESRASSPPGSTGKAELSELSSRCLP